MESTRMRWLVVIAGLGMMFATVAAAQDEAPAPSEASASARQEQVDGAAKANGALDLGAVDGAPVSPAAALPREERQVSGELESPAVSRAGSGAPIAEQTAGAALPMAIPRKETDGARGLGRGRPATRAETRQLPRSAHSSAGQVPWYRNPYAALLGVLVLIVAVSALIKRYVPSARPVANDALRVVGRTALSAKQSAVLLQVGNRLVLVGVTSDSVRALAEITDEGEVAQLMGKASPTVGAPGQAFDATLAQELEKYDGPSDGAVEQDPVDDAQMEQARGQLQNLLGRLRAMQTD